jgi:hypothetical protein
LPAYIALQLCYLLYPIFQQDCTLICAVIFLAEKKIAVCWQIADLLTYSPPLSPLDSATEALAGDRPSEANHLATAGCQSKAMVLRNCHVRWPRLEKVIAVGGSYSN